jgi:thiol:disulfide interchange protein
MKSQMRKSVFAVSAASILISVIPASNSYAADATPAPSHSPATSPLSSQGNSHQHGLTAEQKSALQGALATYKAAIKSALDGANKAVADARSIRDQALAAAPQDKNVKNLANSDFKNSLTQIWSAFRTTVAAAKATYDAAASSIKAAASK